MKNLMLLLLLSFCMLVSQAQTKLLGATQNGDFENGSTGWTLVNGSQVNRWVVSNNATAGFEGNGCIYISSSSAAPYAHNYSATDDAYSYFYRDVAVPAGTQNVWLVFDYICNGQWETDGFGNTSGMDGLRIYSRQPTTAVTAGEELPNLYSPAGAYVKQNSWKRHEVRYLNASSFAGSTMRLIFQWYNDGDTEGNQPPAAIDNIEVYASCQSMFKPSFDNLSGTSVRLAWSVVSGATGYEIRYRKQSEPTTVATYVSPLTVSGGTNYYTTISSLAPGSDYLAEIRPVGTGSTCTDYSAPVYFSTAAAPVNDLCSNATALSVENNACDGTPFSFLGATPTTSLASTCLSSADNDVWFKFVAAGPRQFIQTTTSVLANEAGGIELYTGSCSGLQAVTQPCATSAYSPVLDKLVWRLETTGLVAGTAYFVRVKTTDNATSSSFRICVFNPPLMPACPVLLTPSNNTTDLSTTVTQEFTWRTATNAKAYRFRIVEQSGAYSEEKTTDTVYRVTLSPGKTYTWNVAPYNIADELTTCSGSFTLTTCAVIANTVTLSATKTEKCLGDAIKIKASSAPVGMQWLLNGKPIDGITADSLMAVVPGTYTVRISSGNCYSQPSNSIVVSNLATPAKPSLNVSGSTTFCAGSSVTLTSSVGSANNQWFNGTTAINGATTSAYTATQSGDYYMRLTLTSTGCSSYSDTVVVSVTPAAAAPAITALGATTFCSGGNVKLEASTSQGLQWYKDDVVINGATAQQYTVTAAGSYTARTTANACPSASSNAVVVTVAALSAAPTITASGSLNFCPGDSVRLQSSATSGNQWLKNGASINGATGQQYTVTEAAAYSVQTTANSCPSAISATSTTILLPLPAQPTVTGVGSLLSATPGHSSYQWYLNNNAIGGATSSQYTTSQNGLYKVEVANASGCKISSVGFNQVTSVVNEVVWQDASVKVYPNPVIEKLSVHVSRSVARNLTADLLDASGNRIVTLRLKAGANTLTLAGLPMGIYQVVLRNGAAEKTIRIVKTN